MNEVEKNKDKTVIATTEKFRIKIWLLKWTIGLLITGVLLVGFYLAFEIYFYLSFVMALIIAIGFLDKLYEAPGTTCIEYGLSSMKDDESDILSITEIPHNVLDGLKKKGTNILTIESKSGKKVIIAEKVDLEKNLIVYPWAKEVSSWEFMKKKEIFLELKNKLKDLMGEVLKTKETRDLYHKLEVIKMLDYMESEKDIEEIEKKLEAIK